MKEIKVKMNKPTYLDISTLDISKTLMYEFWYDYIKPRYQVRVQLCYMDVKIFMNTFLMTLKNGLTHQTTAKMIIDCFQ